MINPKEENMFMMPNHEKKKDYYVNRSFPNWNTNFNSKIGNKRTSSYETKASISLIPKRRMCLWSPITEKKVIILWIHVYSNWNTNFNSKIGNKRSFTYETKAPISLIPKRIMCLWCSIIKKNGDFYVNPCLSQL